MLYLIQSISTTILQQDRPGDFGNYIKFIESLHNLQINVKKTNSLQCSDTVGWATGRISGL